MSDTLYENYDAPATELEIGTVGDSSASFWESEVFTVGATAHTVSSIKLLIARRGTLASHVVTVSVKAVDGSFHPTGADLASVTYDPVALSTSATLVEFTFASPADLSANTAYAIVVRFSSGTTDASNNLGMYGTGSPGSGVT